MKVGKANRGLIQAYYELVRWKVEEGKMGKKMPITKNHQDQAGHHRHAARKREDRDVSKGGNREERRDDGTHFTEFSVVNPGIGQITECMIPWAKFAAEHD